MNNDIAHEVHVDGSNDFCSFLREVSFEKMEKRWQKGWVERTSLQTLNLVSMSESMGGRLRREQKTQVAAHREFRPICLENSSPYSLTIWKCLVCDNTKVVRPSTYRSSALRLPATRVRHNPGWAVVSALGNSAANAKLLKMKTSSCL